MKSRVLSNSSDWRNLYAAALFEDDKAIVAVRVAEAESVMLTRAKSLIDSPDANRKETLELIQCLRMLRLLKHCLGSELGTRSAA